MDFEDQLAHLTPATRHFAHQIDGLQTDRHALQRAVTPPLADHIIHTTTLWTKLRLILKAEIKLDCALKVFCALILVLDTNSKRLPQQSMTQIERFLRPKRSSAD